MPHAQGGQSRRGPGGVAWTDRLQRHEDEGTEPAWMQDDNATGFDDPAIARFAADDSLVKFKPGEDLIAAGRHPHLDAPAGDKWRRPMDLPAFFAAPANDAPAHGSGPSRPRTFNAADFLKTSKPDSDGEEDEAIKIPRPQSDDQEQSRFHRFFNVPAGVAAADTGGASPNTAPLVEAGRPFSGNRIRVSPQLPDSDRASRLMDLLSLNVSFPLCGYEAVPHTLHSRTLHQYRASLIRQHSSLTFSPNVLWLLNRDLPVWSSINPPRERPLGSSTPVTAWVPNQADL